MVVKKEEKSEKGKSTQANTNNDVKGKNDPKEVATKKEKNEEKNYRRQNNEKWKSELEGTCGSMQGIP
jgi:hypothetical protein